MKLRKSLILAGVLCIAIGGVFYIRHQQKMTQQRASVEGVVRAAGPAFLAQAYKLPQSDYRKLMQLKDSMLQSRKISDPDLDWLLALLKPSSSSITRSRVLAMLQLLGNAPQSQKEKIRSGIAPFLNDDNPLYRNSVKKVQKFVLNQ